VKASDRHLKPGPANQSAAVAHTNVDMDAAVDAGMNAGIKVDEAVDVFVGVKVDASASETSFPEVDRIYSGTETR
jgi:hypothetical protein